MPTGTFEYHSDAERLAIESAISFVAEMRALAQTAPAGAVLSLCEGQALKDGRELLRRTLRDAVQSRIDSGEQKGAKLAGARAPGTSASSDGTVRGS